MNERKKLAGMVFLCIFMLSMAFAGCGRTMNTTRSQELNESEQADVAECSSKLAEQSRMTEIAEAVTK